MTDLRLTIAPDRVTLQGANLSVEQTPQGLQPGMADYLRLLDRVRVSRDDRRFAPGRGGVDPQRAVGVLLHSAYLAGPVADHLDVLIEGGAVRIGLALDDRLAALPWETVGPVRATHSSCATASRSIASTPASCRGTIPRRSSPSSPRWRSPTTSDSP